MEECLTYFRQAVHDPLSVPPWSEWWAEKAGLVEGVFSLVDFVRLRHRRLLGARQILQRRGELPEGFEPPSFTETGSCEACGERCNQVVSQGVSVNCLVCSSRRDTSIRD